MKSIFRLEEIRSYDSEGHWYRDASIGIVGHYSSLEKVMEAMLKNGSEAWDAEEIMAYMVKEIAVDGEIGEVSWLSVRTYDTQGTLIDECLQDYNLCNQFEGRNREAIRFKIGDIVEALEGRRLYTAIVSALPPTPDDHFPILDALDDCYLVLPLDATGLDHLHIAPTHTFTLQHLIEKEGLDYLRNRLLIYQGRQDETDMWSICAIEGHQYLYNFASMPSKCICSRCHQKWKADYRGDLIQGEIWHEVDAFEGDTRTNEKIIKVWSGH